MPGRWGLLLVALSACGAPPSRVRVVDRVDATGYSTRDVELVTLDDLATLSGDAARIWGSTTLDLTAAVPLDHAGSRDRIVGSPLPVHLQWINAGGVAIPTDYDSLNMLSAYAHVEEAVLFFRGLDLAAAAPDNPVPVYYQPRVVAGPNFFPTTDNAAYLANVDGLVLLPMSVLREIPFSMNPGVLAHEFTHRIWNYEAWGGDMFAILAGLDSAGEAGSWNLIRGVDEGVADFFGALVADDPAFLESSLSDELAATRDLRPEWPVLAEWTDGTAPRIGEAYNPYGLGSVVAALLWSFAELSGRSVVTDAVLAAESSLSASLHTSLDYEIGGFESSVLATLPAGDRPALCARARRSYEVVWSAFLAVCPP